MGVSYPIYLLFLRNITPGIKRDLPVFLWQPDRHTVKLYLCTSGRVEVYLHSIVAEALLIFMI
jgi:hypothetical protein